MAKTNQITSKSKKEAVPQVTPVVDGWSTVFQKPNEAETSEAEAETAPAPKPKRPMFTAQQGRLTGKGVRKNKVEKPPSERRTFIILDSIMEKVYLLKYWEPKYEGLSDIINEALQEKIDKYEKEKGILYPPPQ
jgi:hypothetical protein